MCERSEVKVMGEWCHNMEIGLNQGLQGKIGFQFSKNFWKLKLSEFNLQP